MSRNEEGNGRGRQVGKQTRRKRKRAVDADGNPIETPAERKARIDHEIHVARVTPRIGRDETTRVLWDVDGDRGFVESRATWEGTLGCDGLVSSEADPNSSPPPNFHTLIQVYNLKNWGYADGCTAILVAESFAAFKTIAPPFCVVRGGRPHRTEAWSVFASHDYETGCVGSVSLSATCRTIDFAVTRDQVARTLESTGPCPTFRSNEWSAKKADMHVLVRFRYARDAIGIVESMRRVASTSTSDDFVEKWQATDAEAAARDYCDDEGSMIRTRWAFDGVPLSTLKDSLSRQNPDLAYFFCVVASNPNKFLSSANARSAILKRNAVAKSFLPTTAVDRHGAFAATDEYAKSMATEPLSPKCRTAKRALVAMLIKTECDATKKEGIQSCGTDTNYLLEALDRVEAVLQDLSSSPSSPVSNSEIASERRQLSNYIRDTFLMCMVRKFDADAAPPANVDVRIDEDDGDETSDEAIHTSTTARKCIAT